MGRRNRTIILVLGGLAVGLSAVLAIGVGLAPLPAWLVGWSIATFAAHGIDKAQARRAGLLGALRA